MKRRLLLKLLGGAGLGTLTTALPMDAKAIHQNGVDDTIAENDRAYWVKILTKIANPILSNISKQQLRKNMPMEVSPTFDNRDAGVGYLEAFGRLLAGMAPWLALPDDGTEEGELRKKFRKQALLGIQYGVDPQSPDYFTWRGPSSQTLVDAAHLALAFLRAPKALWDPLDAVTKKRVIAEFQLLRKIKPNESNWLLFAAMTETFLHRIGEECIREKIDYAVNKFDQEWYVGDGWYSDGARFSFDHYNGYVIHCMQVETLRHNMNAGTHYKEMFDRAYKRMQRYAHHLERMISPEGYYMVVGRSSTYKNAAFQPLAAIALENKLPEDIAKGQVRAALTAVLKHIYIDKTFAPSGWLRMGVVGNQQENLADYYTNAGSMYVASLSFLPLGLPANDEFWTCKPEKWTSQKCWNAEQFPKDYYVNY
ncbi:DUF2264 domain-containing protein [Sphingobacterium sp. SRCM116780]|uniref:DUF2264 domain-containing protein n=1 Tax=Sphingobacterium sp. SRCM116780 TaxID=2907623 RepID=UPI001F24FC13|nr:DUF2264 domain-containing protein [Sphingobacterium sp. SRCM116780]UIR55460.1 DUF2264 domain-containing protein [Sphingobacterium sp. SRCM116780]